MLFRMLILWQCQQQGWYLVKIPLYICTSFEQRTYLGYVLLEAPREYVQHGPRLSINWLRLCPHLGPASEATPSGGVLMTAAHISLNVFSL